MPTRADPVGAAARQLQSAIATALGTLTAADRNAEAVLAKARDSARARRQRVTIDEETRHRSTVARARQTCAAATASLAPGAAGLPLRGVSEATSLPLAAATFLRVGSLDAVPVLLPLLDSANILVRSSGNTLGIVHSLVLRAVLATGPGQLVLHGFDPGLRGLFSPFAGLRQTGPDRAADVGTTTTDLARLCEQLTGEVRRIGDLRRGRASTLGDLRTAAEQPIESFQLVVLLDLPKGLTTQLTQTLKSLLLAGPACGISFLLHHDPASPAPVEPMTAADVFDDACEVLHVGQTGTASWSRLPEAVIELDEPLADTALAATIDAAAALARGAGAPHVDFAGLLSEAGGRRTSVGGVAVPIGRDGLDPVEIVLGDEHEQRHNMLVTGAVGQGKSNFLKIFIHAITSLYDAGEVGLYLIDLKEGVTFFPLVAAPGKPDWLPNARIIGLESDREFAVAVLEHLVDEFERRASVIKPHADKISTYRQRMPDAAMPRLIVVIDEFHVLFQGDDDVARRAVELLERLARQGRAYGIHLVLASQTISGITPLLGKQDGIYSQFPIRVAFKNSVTESRTVLSEQNVEAARLRYRGEAIVNLDFGQLEANRRVVVASADDEDLARIRRESWSRRTTAPAPTVFSGSRPVGLDSATGELYELRRRARARAAGPVALVGTPVTLPLRPGGPVLSRQPGRHLAVLGSGGRRTSSVPNLALGAIEAAVVSLALQHPAGDAIFTLLNALAPDDDADGIDDLIWLVERLGFAVTTTAPAGVAAQLRVDARDLLNATGEGSRYLIALGLDQAPGLDQTDEAGQTAVDALRTIIRDGPIRGVHLLGWWSSIGVYRTHLGFDAAVEIDSILALRVSQRDVVDLMGHTVTWHPRDNRGLFYDRQEHPQPLTIVPMSPLDRATAHRILRMDWDA